MTTTTSPRENYDVFLSFRGTDTRAGFTSHLYAALKRKLIVTFIDNNLERGGEISFSILQAIENSTLSLIVFSENYAFSGWCLDELLKIVECRKNGQIVLPIFYQVDPSHVRNQTGSFGDAFAKHEQDVKAKMDKMQSWRAALKEAANLCGYDSKDSLSESEFVEKIVREIENRLKLSKLGSTFKMDTAAADFKPESYLLKEFHVPNYIIESGSEFETTPQVPEFPALVFIDSKSKCQMGANLFKTYCSLLNKNQVFDMEKEAPDIVLRRIHSRLDKLKFNGYKCAAEIQKRLRIIVAGDDGTVGRLLAIICNLKLSHPPRIASIPLGTENNISYAFGCGNKNPGTDDESVISFLKQVTKAKEMKIDNWNILVRMKASKAGSGDAFALPELPLAFRQVSTTHKLYMEGYAAYHAGFCHYFSFGINAQVAYRFNSEMKWNAEKFKNNQLVNESTCAKVWHYFKQRRFSATDLLNPFSRNLAQLVTVKIMKKRDGWWQKLELPGSIRSIVCLNFPSFPIFGGVDPWGTPNSQIKADRDLAAPPSVKDELLEVVGFGGAWHELALLAPQGHATRIAQVHGIRFEFHKGGADRTYMMVDGEPWMQPPSVEDDNAVVIEISHLGQVNMLTTDKVINVEDCERRKPVA